MIESVAVVSFKTFESVWFCVEAVLMCLTILGAVLWNSYAFLRNVLTFRQENHMHELVASANSSAHL